MSSITLTVNRQTHTIDTDPTTPLLYVLSDDLGLRGPKFGCGLGQCGACTVISGGRAIRSCVTPVSAVSSAEITTLEGLGTPERPHPIQKAFIDEQAAQCGYCTSGMVVSAVALLRGNHAPTEREVREALDGNLCRCGAHRRIVGAVMKAASEVAEQAR